MGFSALQGKGVHEALLARQDAEIRLIETMRRCLSQKAKCDRDYATAMVNVTQTGLKVDRGDDLTGEFYCPHLNITSGVIIRIQKTRFCFILVSRTSTDLSIIFPNSRYVLKCFTTLL